MDKYTVDLDQVLNDFEYSELTDQHQHVQQQQTKPATINHYKNNTAATKHSINNVFSSLNEYLNTEIADVDETEAKQVNYCQKTQPAEKILELPKEIVVEPEEIIAEEEKVEETGQSAKIDDEIDLIPENLDAHDDSSSHVALITTNDERDSSSCQGDTQTIELIDTKNSTDENDEIIHTEIVDESDEAAHENKVKTIGFDDLNLDDSELNRYLEELEIEYENESQTIEQPPEIDEIAEKEEEKPVEEAKESDEIAPTRPNNLDLAQTTQSELTNNNSEEETDENPTSNKNIINLVGEPGSTPYNNVYISKELPKPTETSEKQQEEESSTASPTFSEVSTETTSSAASSSSCTPSTDTVNDDDPPATIKEAETGETNAEQPENGEQQPENAAPSAEPPTSSAPMPSNLGKEAPWWIPDTDAANCMHCEQKFSVIRRRHHCRACGYVLCSKCCGLKYHLDYLDEVARVCNRCYNLLMVLSEDEAVNNGMEHFDQDGQQQRRQPNPNNPLEYCSTIPPHQQVAASSSAPSVMVPVGVLKRTGSNKVKHNKSVMFCDGIRPGSDLTNLDMDFSYKQHNLSAKKPQPAAIETNRKLPMYYEETKSFLPATGNNNANQMLPPIVKMNKTELEYAENAANNNDLFEQLKQTAITFALQLNLLVAIKIVNMECCINKLAWNLTTSGLINVGQDEIVILLEVVEGEREIPVDLFHHINHIYQEALKGHAVKEMGLSLHPTTNFLNSKNHAGFIYIRPTYQCMQNVIQNVNLMNNNNNGGKGSDEPYLIGLLIHRWETPWAKLFPLRLILRLGAEYRYYPSPIISNRYRDSVFVEIGHTIINLLADFRNYSYSLTQIRGLIIHMEEKCTTVVVPKNRYDQVMKCLNNSSDHILAFAGSFSAEADSHLVCIQDTQSNDNNYSTHAINIHNKPRKVTGASFIVFNGALKSSSGLTAKSSIVEDGLMIQIPSEEMQTIRDNLRNMKNHQIQCGCINAPNADETVNVVWGEADRNFNLDVYSPIDNRKMEGVPSIRVHNGKDYINSTGTKLIRWTEVFIVEDESESGMGGNRNQDPLDISKLSETIARGTCLALVKYLDLLYSNNLRKIAVRVDLNAMVVAYVAGGNCMKLPPIYMERLDNELVPILNGYTNLECDDGKIVLELIFRILHK